MTKDLAYVGCGIPVVALEDRLPFLNLVNCRGWWGEAAAAAAALVVVAGGGGGGGGCDLKV